MAAFWKNETVASLGQVLYEEGGQRNSILSGSNSFTYLMFLQLSETVF